MIPHPDPDQFRVDRVWIRVPPSWSPPYSVGAGADHASRRLGNQCPAELGGGQAVREDLPKGHRVEPIIVRSGKYSATHINQNCDHESQADSPAKAIARAEEERDQQSWAGVQFHPPPAGHARGCNDDRQGKTEDEEIPLGTVDGSQGGIPEFGLAFLHRHHSREAGLSGERQHVLVQRAVGWFQGSRIE